MVDVRAKTSLRRSAPKFVPKYEVKNKRNGPTSVEAKFEVPPITTELDKKLQQIDNHQSRNN